MGRAWIVVLLAAAAASLAACEGRPYQTGATAPTVSYSYNSRADYDAVADRAEAYCYERYRGRAYLVEEYRVDRGYEVTFACE